MEKIELIGVNKSFKEEKVLKDICLTLTDDKIYGFVGRNGSGKSVLFKIICGYVIADSGKIMIDGKELGKDMDFPEGLGALIETPGCRVIILCQYMVIIRKTIFQYIVHMIASRLVKSIFFDLYLF